MGHFTGYDEAPPEAVRPAGYKRPLGPGSRQLSDELYADWHKRTAATNVRSRR
jgi:hypothetical protein